MLVDGRVRFTAQHPIQHDHLMVHNDGQDQEGAPRIARLTLRLCCSAITPPKNPAAVVSSVALILRLVSFPSHAS